MVPRTQLAILDHNNNVGRPQTVDDDGGGRYKIVFPKATKCWVAKPIYEPKSYLYRRELLSEIIALREKKTTILNTYKVEPLPAPIASRITSVKRPEKSKIIKKRISRFSA